jgi:hypothetical protein
MNSLRSALTCSSPARDFRHLGEAKHGRAMRVSMIPAPGTADPDHNPPRIAARNLFDLGVGFGNLLHKEHYKLKLTLMTSNLTNKVAVYNFLSTFSGTHFVTPRAYQAELGLEF